MSMSMWRRMPLDAETLRRVESTVHEAEASTSGEIAVVIAPRSARWSSERVAVALPAMGLAALAFAMLADPHAAWLALAMPVLFLVAWGVAGTGPVLRALAGAIALDAAVQRAAKVAFVEHGVHATQTRAGVLIYLSLFERHVHILGDAAAHAAIGDQGWRRWAERLGEAMKTQDADAFVAIVREIGDTLAQRFPRGRDDKNELADAVRFTRAR